MGAAALGVVLSLAAGAACAESLADAIELAYRTNPALQQQRAQQRATDEEYVQAQAGFRPTINADATTTYSNGYNPGFFTTYSKSQSSQAGFTITQPIYTGGRIATAVNAAQADVMAGRENLRTAEQNTMILVIQAYVDVRRDTEALNINQANREVLQKQLDEVNAQFEVGEVTRTDVAQAQARLSAAEAALAAAQAQLEVSRSNYTDVVGQRPGTLDPEPDLPLLADSFDAAMNVAVQDNPQLRAAQYTQQAAQHRVAEARSAYLPEVNAQAGYNWVLQPNSGPPVSKRGNASITGQLTVPLFTGGLTQSQVRVALEKDNAARIAVDASERDVLRQVSQAWAHVLSTRASMTSNEAQVKATEIAAEGARQEYQVGLRTTIDVLNAEQELRDAQLALVGSRHDYYLASAQLLQAMGRLEAKNLVQGVKVYDPKKNFDRVKWRGTVIYDKALETVDNLARFGGGHADATVPAPIDTELNSKTPRVPLPKQP